MTISNVFLIELDKRPLPAEIESLLAAAHVDSDLHQPDLFVLRFRDPDRRVIATTRVRIGSAVKIGALASDGARPEPLMLGEVTALEAEFDGGGTFTVIRGYDLTHRLFRGRRTATFMQVTAADVAGKVARRANLPIGSIEPTTTVFDHLSQGGMTDWEFLSGLASDAGYEIAVVDGRFNFRRPRSAALAPSPTAAPVPDPLVLRLGTDLLRLRAVVTSAEQVKEVEVRGWDVSQKRALVATAPAATVSAKLPTVTPASLAHEFGDQVHVSSGVAYRSQSQVDAAAGAIAEQIASAFAQFEGVARGNPKIRANTAISLDNLGAPFDGKYTVTSCRHSYDAISGYRTAISVTGRQAGGILPVGNGAGAASAPGVVIATVSDTDDPLQQGRVTLSFPWLSGTYVSDWSRTVQPGAGRDRGAMVVPEVGDEVLVAFEQGDFSRPYVLGGLYNGVDSPRPADVPLVDPNSGQVNRRSLVSRRGHRIDLFDQDGRKEGIALSSGDGKLRLELDSTGTKVTIGSDGTVVVEGKRGIVIDAGASSLELKGAQISLNAKSGVVVDGGAGSVKLNAAADLVLRGAFVRIN